MALFDSRGFIEKCACMAVLVAVAIAAGNEKCDVSKCKGPVKLYKDMGCTPIYEHEGDCCPVEYNCDHLEKRSQSKCYANGHEYNRGDRLKEEDANPCDLGCFCSNITDIARFECAVVDCYHGHNNPNCFMRGSPDKCCRGPEVCLAEGEKRATCEVDGKVYQDGDYFQPASDPELNCYCMPGYEGKNEMPFCKKLNRPPCALDFRNPSAIVNKCAPVFYPSQNPATDCAVVMRCQSPEDEVVHTHDELTSSEEADTRTCKFGNLTLHHWDELKEIPGFDSQCVDCVCDMPPLVTCRRREKCD